MSGDALDMTGVWNGVFRYPEGGFSDTPFRAEIADGGGRLSGVIGEPHHSRADRPLEAVVAGHRNGAGFDFTKTYDLAGGDYDTPVDYVGSLSPDGSFASGVWSLLDWDGTFEMVRESTREAETEVERTESEPVA